MATADPTPRLAPFDKRLVEVRPDNAAAAVRMANDLLAKRQIDGVNVLGFVAAPTDALADLAPVRRIQLQSCQRIDVSPLYAQRKLDRLVITSTPVAVDLAQFKQLRSFSGFWHPKTSGLNQLRKLKSFAVWKLDDRYVDVESLELAPTVQELWFTQCGIRSLKGIKQLAGLKELELAHLRGPVDVAEAGSLRKLIKVDLQKISRLEGLPQLGKCKSLDYLHIEDCGKIDSIEWLLGLKKLTAFEITETQVLDGDFSVIRKLPSLTQFAADNRRNYRPSITELEAYIDARAED